MSSLTRIMMLRLSRTTTGTVLSTLDALLVCLIWPAMLWMSHPHAPALLSTLADVRSLAYPIFNLLLLFAMGMYRRDAVLDAERSVTRVPLVVGLGAVAAFVFSLAQLLILHPDTRPSVPDQALLFALAVSTFTFCAFLARLVIAMLVRRHVLRRRLLIIGAGRRAWDLLLMLKREGSSLHDHITLLHDPALGPLDPRLEAEPPGRIYYPEAFNVAGVARAVGRTWSSSPQTNAAA
ncbi:MAG: hypothetical protein ACJ8AI_26495 [Rhodopila sp.]